VTQFSWKAEIGWVAVATEADRYQLDCEYMVDPAANVPIVGESVNQAAVQASSGAVAPRNYDGIIKAFQGTCAEEKRSPRSDGIPTPRSTIPRRSRFHFKKDFHVSPFMPMDQEYEWIFSEPADTMLVQNMNMAGRNSVFVSQLRLSKQALSLVQLLYLLFVAFPLLTHRIQLWIHVEAFRLWWKGVDLFPHPHGSSSGFTKLVTSFMAPFMALAAMFSNFRARNKNS
jgi:hypothetical protein